MIKRKIRIWIKVMKKCKSYVMRGGFGEEVERKKNN